MKNPPTAPNKVGDKMHKNIGPGIAKAWSKVYR